MDKHQAKKFTVPTEYGGDDGLKALYRLYWLVERMLQKYVSSVLGPERATLVAFRRSAGPSATTKYGITPAELGRLRRAVFNYELHCRLGDTKVPASKLQLPSHLTNMALTPWELEEVLSIRHFMQQQWNLVFAQHEQEWDVFVRGQIQEDTADPKCPRYLVSELLHASLNDVLFLKHVGLNRDPSQVGPDSACISRLTGFGLKFFQHLVQADITIRSDFINQTMWPMAAMEEPQRIDLVSASSRKTRADDANVAWREVARKKGTTSQQRAALRHTGWVFWGAPRLATMRLRSNCQITRAAAAGPLIVNHRAGSARALPAMVGSVRRVKWNKVVREFGTPRVRGEKACVRALRWVRILQTAIPRVDEKWVGVLRGMKCQGTKYQGMKARAVHE